MNSLTIAAGERMPKTGTMSTCNQFSTADPMTAPTTRPPTVMIVAFPAIFLKRTKKKKKFIKHENQEEKELAAALEKKLKTSTLHN